MPEQHPADTPEDESQQVPGAKECGGIFRGIAAAFRSSQPALRSGVRAIGAQRTLAFASEGGVAGKALIPKPVYYGAWGLSGIAIIADIATKMWDAPVEKQQATVLYNIAFHVPASLVIPAVAIHQLVHGLEHSMKNHSYASALPPRAKTLVPVVGALMSVPVVVPVIDHAAEAVMEPTLGKYLGLEFDHHHPNNKDDHVKTQ